MRLLVSVLALTAVFTATGVAAADLFPYVVKGPVITGVTDTDAWVAWYTSHHQGSSSFLNECYNDALTGTPNDTIPQLTLTSGGSFSDSECSRFHKVHLTGLAPNAIYSFALDKPNADGTPAVGQFATAPAPAETPPVKFLIYGDDRDNPITSASTRPDHEALVSAMLDQDGDAAFLVNVGDYALNYPAVSGDDRGYAAFYDVERELLATRPIVAVFGNHESIDTTYFDGLMSPTTFASKPHPYYFSFDWGRVHVACLNSFEGPNDLLLGGARQPELTDAQAQWLDGDLAAAKSAGKILFVVTHQGAYSHGIGSTPHGGLTDVETRVVPLMLKHGALGMFAGHDHYYQRGHEGCIDYVVTGAGGAEKYEPDPNAPGVAVTFEDVSYVAVTVDADGVAQAETKDALGNVVDQFVLKSATCDPDPPDAGPDADAPDAEPPSQDASSNDAEPTKPDAATGDAADDDGADAQDAEPSTDSGASPHAMDDAGNDGGCACTATPGSPSMKLAWLVALAAAVLSRRKRRNDR